MYQLKSLAQNNKDIRLQGRINENKDQTMQLLIHYYGTRFTLA